MEIKKDFSVYSTNRVGLPPRDLAKNNIPQLIRDAVQKRAGRDIVVVEFGFSHGNDSRFICHVLYQMLGERGWQFWAYDHYKHIEPSNIFYGVDGNFLSALLKNVKIIPCTFETIASGDIELPSTIDICYSSKSLSLCEKELLPQLFSKIYNSILDSGYLCCSLHLKNSGRFDFLSYDEYMELLFSNCGVLFDGDSLIESFIQGSDNFSFITKKSRKHNTLYLDTIGNRYCEEEYKTKYTEEKTLDPEIFIDSPIIDKDYSGSPIITVNSLFASNAGLKQIQERVLKGKIRFAFLDYNYNGSLDYASMESISIPSFGLPNPIAYYDSNSSVLAVRMPMGSVIGGCLVENLIYCGIKTFIALGTAGLLTKNNAELYLAEKAIRDEGLSYHYLPKAQHVETSREQNEKLYSYLNALGYSIKRAIVWTTDAIYRETDVMIRKRVEDGAQLVEMECASIAAVCKHWDCEFSEILVPSDSIAEIEWKRVNNKITIDNLLKRIAKEMVGGDYGVH